MPPKVSFSTSSISTPGKLLINQDTDEDNSHIGATELSSDDMKQNSIASSSYTTANNSKTQQHEKAHCNLFKLLALCCSWFCGLDPDKDDHSEYHPTTIENGTGNEKQPPTTIQIKERRRIKWLLNTNLVVIILVEIALFTVFTIPAKYTFLRE